MTLPDGTVETLSYTPGATLAEVQAWHPEAVELRPCPLPTPDPARALSAKDKALVTAALDAMGEDDAQIRSEVLDRCATDPAALSFWVSRAPNPRQALYQAWLSGISEARALLTLTEAQAREAVAAGVVSREAARGSVLVLVKLPGTAGLLAIPQEKYRDFSPLAAVEALGILH